MKENKAAKEREKIISLLTDYLEEHLTEDIHLDDIAGIAGYSKFYLSRMFSDTVGCTIGQYVQKRRLTEAARQLLHTDTPIIDIALYSGYESQQAFSYAFKQLYQVPPLVYRRKGSFIPKQVPYTGNRKEELKKTRTMTLMLERKGAKAA